MSFSAVGSLREDMKPGDFVLVDQYVDKTKRGPEQTFFGNGVVAHVSMAHPACEQSLKQFYDFSETYLKNRGLEIHQKATYLNMEGPAFSTKAESALHRQWGMDVVGMTNYAEAKLCREAELSYLTVAMVTDFDCWHPDHDAVTVETVIGQLMKNADHARDLLAEVIPQWNFVDGSCQTALQNGLLTPLEAMSNEIKERLTPLLKRFL